MRFITLHILLLLCGQLFSQTKKHLYVDAQVKIEYHTKNGLMDGKYISHYTNGKKKAEGHFKNNLRDGKWVISDTSGKIHFAYNGPIDSLKRNSNGYFDYTFLKQEDIVVEKRVWRNVYKENNHLLFSSVNLFDSLYNHIQKDSLLVFKDEEFATPVNIETIKNNFSPEKFEIAAYKIKEDWFFDKKKNSCETRVIGIYLVLKPHATENEENIGLGWIYYPHIRKYLARQIIHDKNLPITNLEDIFWYRYFHGNIYKETNMYDRPIAAYEKTEEGVIKEAERIELSMIEMEHTIWINMAIGSLKLTGYEH